jgi:hypothetical protein
MLVRRRRQGFALYRYVLAAVAFCLRAQPAPPVYAGSGRCAVCHVEQARNQARSAHAAALAPVAKHPLAGAFPVGRQFVRKPHYVFEFTFRGPEIRVRITDGTDVMDLPVDWAFGAGRQAVTFVSRVNEEWYVEHYASYYPALSSYGATPGQSSLQPDSLPHAAGVVYKIHDPDTGIAGCFQCHSTGAVTFGAGGRVQLGELGVRCEACHGPGATHAANPNKNNVLNPKLLSADRMNEYCGRCHRPPAQNGVRIDWNYAWNVRHQPVYLSESRCFQRSRGALSCVTCHDPHEPAGQRKALDYNARCAACHTAKLHPPKEVCTKGSANCVDCHMPLVSPQSPLRFTNHWIGVYRGGSNLKPVR